MKAISFFETSRPFPSKLKYFFDIEKDKKRLELIFSKDSDTVFFLKIKEIFDDIFQFKLVSTSYFLIFFKLAVQKQMLSLNPEWEPKTIYYLSKAWVPNLSPMVSYLCKSLPSCKKQVGFSELRRIADVLGVHVRRRHRQHSQRRGILRHSV